MNVEAALYGEAYPFGSLAWVCEANGGEKKTSGNTRMDSEQDELVFFNFSLNLFSGNKNWISAGSVHKHTLLIAKTKRNDCILP